MDTKLVTPYYTVQYLLREFAKGLGTKLLSGKKIDDACKKIEINPHQFHELKQELIHKPLTQYVNIYFADHMLSQFNKIIEMYLQLMKDCPLDGVNAESSRKILNDYFITIAVPVFCAEMLDGMKLSPYDIAKTNKPMLSIVLNQLEDSETWQKFISISTDDQKKQLKSWREGRELPDITSIDRLGEKWQHITRDRKASSWGTYKARLITARLWDYFFYRDGNADIQLLAKNSLPQCSEIMTSLLYNLSIESNEKYSGAMAIVRDLFGLLLRRPRDGDSSNECLQLLSQLKKFLDVNDLNHEATYMYYWMNARYNLYSGNLKEAVAEYKKAFEQVIYRRLDNAEKIILEVMVSACRLKKPDKSFINRLRRMAVLLQLDLMPAEHAKDDFKVKPQEIENWEISVWSDYFSSLFSKEMFFKSSFFPANPHRKYGICIVDDKKYNCNLDNPNEVLLVGEDGGLIKDMPQLTYFAMQDDINAVNELLIAGADVNHLTSSKESALIMAVKSLQVNVLPLNSMDISIFNLLVNNSMSRHKPSVVNTLTEKRKESPLGCAVQTGQLEIVSKVLELGANVDKKHGTMGETPLYTVLGMIAHYKNPKLVENRNMDLTDDVLRSIRTQAVGLLPPDLNRLKDIVKSQREHPLFQVIKDTRAKLYSENFVKYTTLQELRDIVKLLITEGANCNEKHETSTHDGYTPLMLAIELDEIEIVKHMIDCQGHTLDFSDTFIYKPSGRRLGIGALIKEFNAKQVHQLLLLKH